MANDMISGPSSSQVQGASKTMFSGTHGPKHDAKMQDCTTQGCNCRFGGPSEDSFRRGSRADKSSSHGPAFAGMGKKHAADSADAAGASASSPSSSGASEPGSGTGSGNMLNFSGMSGGADKPGKSGKNKTPDPMGTDLASISPETAKSLKEAGLG